MQGLLNHPIDIFFNSLAEEKREHSIAVVLSGTGSDGTNGIKAIKEKGGLTIVQSLPALSLTGCQRAPSAQVWWTMCWRPRILPGRILHYSKYRTMIEPRQDEIFTDEESFTHIYEVLKRVRASILPTISAARCCGASSAGW